MQNNGDRAGNENKTIKTGQEVAGNIQIVIKKSLPVVVCKLNIKLVVLLRKRQSCSLGIHKQAPSMRKLGTDPLTLTSFCQASPRIPHSFWPHLLNEKKWLKKDLKQSREGKWTCLNEWKKGLKEQQQFLWQKWGHQCLMEYYTEDRILTLPLFCILCTWTGVFVIQMFR